MKTLKQEKKDMNLIASIIYFNTIKYSAKHVKQAISKIYDTDANTIHHILINAYISKLIQIIDHGVFNVKKGIKLQREINVESREAVLPNCKIYSADIAYTIHNECLECKSGYYPNENQT